MKRVVLINISSFLDKIIARHEADISNNHYDILSLKEIRSNE